MKFTPSELQLKKSAVFVQVAEDSNAPLVVKQLVLDTIKPRIVELRKQIRCEKVTGRR